MSNSHSESRRPAPFSLRLTANERMALQNRAGGLPLGFYVKHVLFSGDAPVVRKPRVVLADYATLGRVLAGLGASRLAQNLNQLAKAANMGSLPVTAELETDLRQACDDVAEMRRALLAALGVDRKDKKVPDTLRDSFGAHAQEAAE